MVGKDTFRRAFLCFLIMFSFIVISFLFLETTLNNNSNYVNHYLSSYTSLHEAMTVSEFPMWSWNLFLGHNLLGVQSYYSLYNPFFLITLLFSTDILSDLYLPLLFLKLALALGMLYLYMKRTQWFSQSAIIIGCVLYLFNGWMLTNLDEFITIELLMFIPLVLYGIERLIFERRKRYFVFGFSLMLISHFTVTLMLLPFLIIYLLMRFNKLEDKRGVLKQFSGSIGLIVCLTAMCILPIILATKELRLEFIGTFDIVSSIKILLKCFFPPVSLLFNEDFSVLSEVTLSTSLYQSVLVGLMIPQFFTMAKKNTRLFVGGLYGLLIIYLVIQPQLGISSLVMQPVMTVEHVGVFIILINTLITAYVITHIKLINKKVLSFTSIGYISGLFISLVVILLHEVNEYEIQMTVKLLRHELLNLTPFIFICLLIVLLIKGYRYIIEELIKCETSLKHHVLLGLVMFEIVVIMLQFLGSYGGSSSHAESIVDSDKYISNQTYAVTDYLKTIDSDFYRIINGFESQSNDSQLNRYPGFSESEIKDEEKHVLTWSLMNEDKREFNVNKNNYFVTTALSSKYYLTSGFKAELPGYRYFDQIGTIIVYENDYFIPIGSRQETYVLEDDFNQATKQQQSYLFLNSLILDEAQVSKFSKVMELVPYNLKMLPDEPKELDYYQAARTRQQTGVSNVSYETNSVRADVFVNKPQLVSFNIPYNSGWKANVNGESITIHEVNGGLMALEFTEVGDYEVELSYTSPGYEIGFSISAITGLIILGVLSKSYYVKREGA